MQEQPAAVSRTHPGLTHRNKLVLRRLVFDILIDKNPAGESLADSFRLVSDDRAYSRTLKRDELIDFDAQHWLLRFKQVLPGRSYSLFHCHGSDIAAEVFHSIPFDGLNEHGPATQAPLARNAQKRAAEREPESESRLAVVTDAEEDRALPGDYRPDPHPEVVALA